PDSAPPRLADSSVRHGASPPPPTRVRADSGWSASARAGSGGGGGDRSWPRSYDATDRRLTAVGAPGSRIHPLGHAIEVAQDERGMAFLDQLLGRLAEAGQRLVPEPADRARSEERRGGKEGRWRWTA